MKTKSLFKPIVFVAGITIASSTLGAYYWKQEHRQPILEVYVFAPKSGRSIFIRTPEDNRILIDGGSNSEIIRHISEILPFYSRRIDMVIATNDAGKNVGGLIDVIQRYEVGDIYLPKYTLISLGLASSTDQIYETFIQTATELNINMEKIGLGQILNLDSKTRLDVLFPADPANFSYSKASPPEVLFNISYGATNVLFAGSASPKVQRYMASTTEATSDATMTSSSVLQTPEVLIVSHSALPSNISSEFIDKFHPAYLVYSKQIAKDEVIPDVETTSTPSSETSNQTANQTANQITKQKVGKTKKKKDPLLYLLPENRFNIKESGVVKIESDGTVLKIH